MKRVVIIVLAIFVSIFSYGQKLVIGSYNVRNGVGMDDVRDLSRASKVIQALAADVVALQELDSVTKRSGGVYVAEKFAELTGMKAFFSKSIDFDGGGYGVGVLCRNAPLKVKRISLPGREELRSLLLVEFDDYIFCSTHFSLNSQDQKLSISLLSMLANGSSKPFFVAGDFNFSPDSEQFKQICESFDVLSDVSQCSYPANDPKVCIDYVFLYKNSNFVVEKSVSRVVDASVESDHRPIFLEVEIKKKTDKI